MADGSETTGGNPGDPHVLYGANGTLATGVRRETTVFQGEWKQMVAEFRKHAQGVKVEDSFAGSDSLVGKPVATAQIAGREAHLAELTLTVLAATPTCYWALDWTPVAKDIHTWKAGGTGEDEDKPDLSQVLAWEQLGANGDKESYNAFLPEPDGEPMTGNTLKLAEKIRMGVTSYTLHAPVLTRTIVLTDVAAYFATLQPVDRVYTAADIGHPAIELENNAQWRDAGAFPYAAALALKPKWLHTSERVTGNPDGTFTCVSQWFGADDIDADLYDLAGGGNAGGGDAGGGNG